MNGRFTIFMLSTLITAGIAVLTYLSFQITAVRADVSKLDDKLDIALLSLERHETILRQQEMVK